MMAVRSPRPLVRGGHGDCAATAGGCSPRVVASRASRRVVTNLNANLNGRPRLTNLNAKLNGAGSGSSRATPHAGNSDRVRWVVSGRAGY